MCTRVQQPNPSLGELSGCLKSNLHSRYLVFNFLRPYIGRRIWGSGLLFTPLAQSSSALWFVANLGAAPCMVEVFLQPAYLHEQDHKELFLGPPSLKPCVYLRRTTKTLEVTSYGLEPPPPPATHTDTHTPNLTALQWPLQPKKDPAVSDT